MATITILTPVPEPKAMPADGEAPKRRLGRKIRLGLLSNGKPNTELLIQGLLDVVQEDQRFQGFVRERKTSSSQPADEAILARLVASADLVVGATAD